MILVYQMAKVGSRAWVEAARRCGLKTLHVHFLSATFRETLEGLLSMEASDSTIGNPFMVRHMLRASAAASEAIAGARARCEPIRLIAGMRDPVARSLSLVFFFADFCDHRTLRISARAAADADDVCEFLRRCWRNVLDGTPPRASFERLLWLMMGSYRSWFDNELKASFGLDPLSAKFQTAAGTQRLAGGGVEALLYRAEDMRPDSPFHAAACSSAAAFLGVPGLMFADVNSVSTRRSAALHANVQDRFRLSAADIDLIYGTPCVRHFYNPTEIERFKLRWRAADGGSALR